MTEEQGNRRDEKETTRYRRQVKIAVYLYVALEAIILMIFVYKILQTR